MNRLLIALPFALALASCGDKAEEAPADDTRGAEGEVLGGTISDAMLPLDTVKSENPPLREGPAPGEGGTAPSATTGSRAPAAAGGGSEAPEATPEPAAEPAPEPAPEDEA